MTQTIWTIGHSTRTPKEFSEALNAYDIALVADVRRFPGSRRLPQFTAPRFKEDLHSVGIRYHWIPALGGRRTPKPDSPNTGWTHPAFRAYADHIATEEFADGLVELLNDAYGMRTAIMCAEVLWWRCHRRLIADVLTTLDTNVIHIRDANHSELHVLKPPARVDHGRLLYS